MIYFLKSTIVLLIILGLFASCSKDKFPDKYTSRLNREVTWQWTYYKWTHFGDTTIQLRDTTLAIEVLSPTSIRFMKLTLTYTEENCPRQPGPPNPKKFVRYTDLSGMGYHTNFSLDYYYHEDSIAVVNRYGGQSYYVTNTYRSRR